MTTIRIRARRALWTAGLGAAVLAGATRPAAAQGFQLRLDSRVQAAKYRGVALDSVPSADTVTGSTGGPTTPDGFAVTCAPGSAYCAFFRPGPEISGAPATMVADLSVWGLGVTGLSFRATARVGTALGDANAWPGTTPALQLLEGYAQYVRSSFIVDLGRQTMTTRFGINGFDGGTVTLRAPGRGLEVTGYGGWGLAQGSALLVTSPALNPLDDFQPTDRQIVAGANAGWTSAHADVRASYLREVDPSVDYFVSERAGLDVAIRPFGGVTLTAGADYDLAAGWWGSAEATLGYLARNGRVAGSLGVRRYRPHFDLWTIWGAFSPVPYRAADASMSFTPISKLRVRASGERYSFDAADVSTPLVTYETSGWRFSWGATITPTPRWTLDGGYHSEFGPGASSRGFEGAVTFAPGSLLNVSLQAASLDRPLEFRFDDSSVKLYGMSAWYRVSSRLRVDVDATRYVEDRQRPDAAAFDWNQVRLSARVVLLLGGGAGGDLTHLPPVPKPVAGAQEAR